MLKKIVLALALLATTATIPAYAWNVPSRTSDANGTVCMSIQNTGGKFKAYLMSANGILTEFGFYEDGTYNVNGTFVFLEAFNGLQSQKFSFRVQHVDGVTFYVAAGSEGFRLMNFIFEGGQLVMRHGDVDVRNLRQQAQNVINCSN